jgi:hypothetical protein
MRTQRRLKSFLVALPLVFAVAMVGAGQVDRAAAAPAKPTVTLSSISGTVGTSLTVTGAGFAKTTAGTVTAGTVKSKFVTSSTGSFSSKIVIPKTTLPKVDIVAKVGVGRVSTPFTVLRTVATPKPTPTVAPTPKEPSVPAISSARLRFGLSTPGGLGANTELNAVATRVGESPSIVMTHVDFTNPAPIAELDSVAARGAVTMLTWEPWRAGDGVTQPAYTNASIASGKHDAYLRDWGVALAKWGKPVYLRYGHEMNGDWYPWSDGVNSNASGSYVAAWKHVHEVLTAQGTTNVQWVWSPNVPYTGSVALPSLYPGANYVDAVALDGYNWGTGTDWSTWTSPSTLFGNGLAQMRAIAPGKQIMIAETASTEIGGSKATWNRELVSYLQAQKDVSAFIWFDFNKEADWRIASSSSSADALKAALALRRS